MCCQIVFSFMWSKKELAEIIYLAIIVLCINDLFSLFITAYINVKKSFIHLQQCNFSFSHFYFLMSSHQFYTNSEIFKLKSIMSLNVVMLSKVRKLFADLEFNLAKIFYWNFCVNFCRREQIDQSRRLLLIYVLCVSNRGCLKVLKSFQKHCLARL